MKRQQAGAVLDRFFDECTHVVPAQRDIEPVLDRVWDRLGREPDVFVTVRTPAGPVRPFRFAWAAGIVLVAVLVNALVWRQGPPFPVSGRTSNSDGLLASKSPAEQGGETLRLTVSQDTFDLASVKLLSPSSETVRAANKSAEIQAAFRGCSGAYMAGAQVDPGRLTIPAATVLSLVIAAYGHDCRLVEGGPAWIRSSEYYEITALLPAGTPSYTRRDFQQSNAPVLQTMLQNLLADRFQLVVKRELREMSVYVLTVSTPAKMKLSADQAPPVTPSPPAALPPPPAPGQPMTVTSAQLGWDQAMAFMSLSGEVQLSGHAISMSALATELRTHAGGLVLDRTGLKGFFDYDLKFARDMPTSIAVPSPQPQPIPPLPGPPPIPPVPAALLPAPSLGAALQEQLGLKMESVRMPIEVLVIERVERPSEN